MKLSKPLIIQSSDADRAVNHVCENVQEVKDTITDHASSYQLIKHNIRDDYKKECVRARTLLSAEEYVTLKDNSWAWVLSPV
jgi:hypothetical protein